VLSADSDFQARASLPSSLSRNLYQLADSLLVENGERILFQDAFLEICRQHFVDVVARETESGLGEVIGSEGKELGFFRNLIGD